MEEIDFKSMVMRLELLHPDWSTEDIRHKLDELGFDRPSSLLVNSIRKEFRRNLEFLVDQGVIDPDPQPRVPIPDELVHKAERRRPDMKSKFVLRERDPGEIERRARQAHYIFKSREARATERLLGSDRKHLADRAALAEARKSYPVRKRYEED